MDRRRVWYWFSDEPGDTSDSEATKSKHKISSDITIRVPLINLKVQSDSQTDADRESKESPEPKT